MAKAMSFCPNHESCRKSCRATPLANINWAANSFIHLISITIIMGCLRNMRLFLLCTWPMMVPNKVAGVSMPKHFYIHSQLTPSIWQLRSHSFCAVPSSLAALVQLAGLQLL